MTDCRKLIRQKALLEDSGWVAIYNSVINNSGTSQYGGSIALYDSGMLMNVTVRNSTSSYGGAVCGFNSAKIMNS